MTLGTHYHQELDPRSRRLRDRQPQSAIAPNATVLNEDRPALPSVPSTGRAIKSARLPVTSLPDLLAVEVLVRIGRFSSPAPSRLAAGGAPAAGRGDGQRTVNPRPFESPSRRSIRPSRQRDRFP